jgi:thiamine-monophosphate kinase
VTEFDLIRRFVRAAPRGGAGVVLGIGDDAAVLRPPRGEDLVLTVDAVVEGVHFDRRFAPGDVGWKALAVNLSDLAAMGARPLWALCALAVPRGADAAVLARVGRGLARCARAHGVALAGGNVTRARELSLTVTAVGSAPPGAALTRAGASPGDVVLVSGTLGEAARGLGPRPRPCCARRQRRPEPRVALGLALRGVASACLDVSDGLLQDLGHLCRASRVGAEVRLSRLPVRHATPEEAAVGGEDYELLFTVSPRRLPRALAAAAAAGVPVAEIGAIRAGRGVRAMGGDGAPFLPPRRGHDHLA